MRYRSTRMKAAPGVVVLPPISPYTRKQRWMNIALDMAAFPLVFAGPRRRVVLDGETVSLEYHFRRWSWRSERAVEIPLALRAMSRHAPDDVLEVGNVLTLYGMHGHTVVDKYEDAPGVLNVDIVDFEPGRRYGLVVSVSTLEHVGWDEEPREPDKASAALETISRLGDELLITIPVGYHPALEAAFLEGPFDSVVLAVRTSRFTRWEQRPLTELSTIQYGQPFAAGNGVLIGSRRRSSIAKKNL